MKAKKGSGRIWLKTKKKPFEELEHQNKRNNKVKEGTQTVKKKIESLLMKAFMSPRDPFCYNSHKQWLNDQSVFTESSLLNQNLSQGERGLPYSLSSKLRQLRTRPH